jgi:PKHD-type hydroxylase
MVSKRNESRQSKERTSHQAVLRRGPETEWLFERLLFVGGKVNGDLWRFALTGIENLQVLRYRPMQRFRWHFDSLPGSGRKITCVVNVGDPGAHWRGKLELMASHEGRSLARLQGSATLFPSYLPHRATAPWWGERWSLVAWLTGPELV